MKRDFLRMNMNDMPVGDSINIGDEIVTDMGLGPVDVKVVSIREIRHTRSGVEATFEVEYEEKGIKEKEGKIVNYHTP